MSHTLTVKSVRKETDDSVCVSFNVPSELNSEFNYKQGQNLTLIRKFNGDEVRRSYSICSSVNDDDLRVGIKQVPEGLFSGWANSELKIGDQLELLPPTGHFYVDLDPSLKRHHVGIAAGSGITPILSILKTTLETEPQSLFTLIYGNKSTETIMFLEELGNLKNTYTDRLRVFHVLSREVQGAELLNGRIDGNKIKQFMQTLLPADRVDEVFLCGPFQMVMEAQDAFIEAGLDKRNVHTELFGTPEDLQAIDAQAALPELSEEQRKHISRVQVVLDGKGTEFELTRGGDLILDAALKIRKELPFACKGGVCATCKAKLVEGEVEMERNYSLSEEEVEAGFILTCQSHPISDRVVIDFDQK